jgi:hypothetical protein
VASTNDSATRTISSTSTDSSGPSASRTSLGHRVLARQRLRGLPYVAQTDTTMLLSSLVQRTPLAG